MPDNASTEAPSREELIAALRARIDEVDDTLLALLNKRSSLSMEVGRIKAGNRSSVFKPAREEEILQRLAAGNGGPLPETGLRAIWREIFSASRSLQRPLRVAYLGPEGTFSYFAGIDYLGQSARYLPCRDLPQVFEEVNAMSCDVGIVPLENSLQGTVGVSFDLFLKYPVVIQAELFSHISHCLLTREDDLSSITTVYSHPQPLAQCGTWLRTHLPGAALVPVESTAAAARRVLSTPGSASIGNGNLAPMLDLGILAKRIEDAKGNWTRFVVISKAGRQHRLGALPLQQGALSGSTKTSLLFTVADKPGALSMALDLLARHGVNMRKLESRPMAGEVWKYAFFCDVEDDPGRQGFRDAVSALTAICTSFRILGSYPAGPEFDRVWEPGDADEPAGERP